MPIRRLPVPTASAELRKSLEGRLEQIYHDISGKFKKLGTLQEALLGQTILIANDLRNEQHPEEFAKRNIIEPLLQFLGFEIVAETTLTSPKGKRSPDYVMKPRDQQRPIFYVEAEPLNMDLYSKNHGVSQVSEWLLSRSSITDYGIATNGFEWILLKYDPTSVKSREIHKVNLKPIFLAKLNPKLVLDTTGIESDLLILHTRFLSSCLENYVATLEEEKEEISRRFYNDYVRLVFGYDKNGNLLNTLSLVKAVKGPPTISGGSSELFSVVFMNRLIFSKFLEEKSIVPKNLLTNLLKQYKDSKTPGTLYETYLRPLFYEVFNKNKDERSSHVKQDKQYQEIPYLNGGLFREVIKNEKDYTIGNEGVELVIDNLLQKYSFGLGTDSTINPDILGYIFEKTINYISGTGTSQQKMEGAYYTPDDVVQFIIEETLIPTIYGKMIDGLRAAGWTETDLKGYNSMQDILDPENMPRNPIAINKMIESIQTIRVLDPACGSGHFLTATLCEILRVEEHLKRAAEQDVDRYKLKREIVSKNLFGVDIDENAVEIARLRLWLSIIEEVENPEHIDTLPNIDLNVLTGNSLIGWLDEDLAIHPLISLLSDPYIQGTLDALAAFYGARINEVRALLEKTSLKDTIEAYKKLLGIYGLEQGDRAVKIRALLEKIREKLYEVVDDSYLAFFSQNMDLKKNKRNDISKGVMTRKPLHWAVDFQDVFEKGGFDVIVGNPPYVEDRNLNPTDTEIVKSVKVKKKGEQGTGEPLFYYSRDCGNTHAYFIERSIKLLRKSGKFGFIVPISLVSTDRMSSIRQFIHRNSSAVKYYNFDDRPGKIFSGLEHCRATIVITEKGVGTDEVTTSKYHRWHTADRPRLFEELRTTEWTTKDPGGIVPKIGTTIEGKILDKIRLKSNGKTIQGFLLEKGTKIWYHNAPQYWVHSHTDNYVPMIERYSNYEKDMKTGETIPQNLEDKTVSSHYKFLTFGPGVSGIINGLLNSTLFYWWFVAWSDGRDLLNQHITSFPIDLDGFSRELRGKLGSFVDELMRNYDMTSNTKINLRSGGYVIKIKEIIPLKSKAIIDQIDDLFAGYFGFDDKEREFIRDFDIGFRTGGPS